MNIDFFLDDVFLRAKRKQFRSDFGYLQHTICIFIEENKCQNAELTNT